MEPSIRLVPRSTKRPQDHDPLAPFTDEQVQILVKNPKYSVVPHSHTNVDALRKARDAGVPAPEVICALPQGCTGQLQDEPGYLVQHPRHEHDGAQCLADVWLTLDQGAKKRVLADLKRLVGQLQRVPDDHAHMRQADHGDVFTHGRLHPDVLWVDTAGAVVEVDGWRHAKVRQAWLEEERATRAVTDAKAELECWADWVYWVKRCGLTDKHTTRMEDLRRIEQYPDGRAKTGSGVTLEPLLNGQYARSRRMSSSDAYSRM